MNKHYIYKHHMRKHYRRRITGVTRALHAKGLWSNVDLGWVYTFHNPWHYRRRITLISITYTSITCESVTDDGLQASQAIQSITRHYLLFLSTQTSCLSLLLSSSPTEGLLLTFLDSMINNSSNKKCVLSPQNFQDV